MKRIIKLVIFSTFIFAFATLVFGESKEEKKVALLIANDDYARDLGKLLQPIKEAEALKKALESIGFKVILLKNANKASMKRTLKSFKDQSRGNIAFFHYGGHAVSVGGKNYLIPLETKIEDEDDLEDECFSVDAVMKNMQGSSNIVVLDSCRNNPFLTSSHRGGTTRGLQAVSIKPQNSIIVYSAQAGDVAIDGVFTPILTQKIVQKGKSFSDILIEVRNEVKEKTKNKQNPGEYREISSQIYLAGQPKNEPIYIHSDNLNVKAEVAQGTLQISTITPCSVYVDSVKAATLEAFGECKISCNTGMRNIKINYKDGYAENKNVVINKDSFSFIEGEYVSREVADACYALGKAEKDEKEAFKWYKKATDGGNPLAMGQIGWYYYEGLAGLEKDEFIALKYFQEGAKQGDAWSIGRVGVCYGRGSAGLKQDEVEALKWYKKAAKLGDERSMCNIGSYYENGLGGLKQDKVEALKWYRKAADAGYAVAMYNIAWCYELGYGCLQDRREALKWFRMALNENHAGAMRCVGYYYSMGYGGLKKDEVEALKWYRKAADAGDAVAINNIGGFYADGGAGLEKDEVEALKWYRKAADAGDAAAMYNVGNNYAYGRAGLKEDKVEALKWYRKAADAGDAGAMRCVGYYYSMGYGGLKKDEVEALKWYRKAADAGDEWASNRLKELGK